MNHLEVVLKGAAIGLAIAAPVGPIGLLCIRRTLAEGRAAGLATGLGAATADAVYGLVAVLGLGLLAAALARHASLLQLAGGALLVWLAIGSLRRAARPAAAREAPADARGLAGAFASTFGLTLANPMTILAFAGVVAALAAPAHGKAPSFLLVLGVFLGSMAWWLMLVAATSLARRALPAGALRVIELVAGAALLGFGGYAIARGMGW